MDIHIHPSNKSERFSSKDLYLCAFMYASGIPLIKTFLEGSNLFFVFSNKSTCIELENTYWMYFGSVVPKKYADSVKSLKDIVHSKVHQNSR